MTTPPGSATPDVAADDPVVLDRIRDGLRRILLRGERAVDVVPTLLRDIDDERRRRIKDRVFGVAVERLRLLRDHRGALHERDIDRLARIPLEDDEGPWPADPIDRLVVRRSCPRWLAERLVASLGVDDADAFLACSNRPGPRTLRANTLVNDRAALLRALRDDGITGAVNPLTPWAVDVVGKANLHGCQAFRVGRFEIQDAGSQCIALACQARPGNVVVDLCAGRGGKTLALAAMMEGRGTLWVDDVDDDALRALFGRLRRARVSFVVRGRPAAGIADVVLVDAPCSSTGVLRRSPDLRYALRPQDVGRLTATQRTLLQQAARLVRPGGRVVYATCSVLREENDDVVEDPLPELIETGRRLLLPSREGCDGFFIATFSRRA